MLTDPSLPETQIRKVAINQSKKTVFLCDKTKFSLSTPYNLVSIETIDCIILIHQYGILNDIDVRIPEDFPDYSLEPLTRSLAYASCPCASEKYIYALCHNEQMLSLSKSIPEIHIWDWYGNLKARVVLDRHIDIFTVDETKGLIYAMDINNSNVLYYQNYSLN